MCMPKKVRGRDSAGRVKEIWACAGRGSDPTRAEQESAHDEGSERAVRQWRAQENGVLH